MKKIEKMKKKYKTWINMITRQGMQEDWKYYVYIAECADWTLYTWVTTDISRRIQEHNNEKEWAKYTKARRPIKIVYSSKHPTRSDACKEEWRIKQLSRTEKLKLINWD